MARSAPSAFWRVSQIARYLKEVVETDDQLLNIRIQGEVSGCKNHTSGHCYFTLKDAEAQLSCVFFKQARLRSGALPLKDGMSVVITGYFSFYERDGRLQFYVEDVEPLEEQGKLYLQLEELKARLHAEGLFDEERKRPLPELPAVIGIATSATGAALQDMLRILRDRYPLVEVLIAPCQVQGDDAPSSIAAALDLLNAQGEAEVLIVGRGGGAIEDLWAFNDEQVARAIERSRIPVVSAVGHEIDVTISDFVADLRAPTPTAAAQTVVPDIQDYRSAIEDRRSQLQSFMEERLYDLRTVLERREGDLDRSSPRSLLDRRYQQVDAASEDLRTSLRHLMELRSERLRSQALQLHSLSPLLTIARGFAVVRKDQEVVSRVGQVRSGDKLEIQVSDGSLQAQVFSVE